jgi:hypothetical protein
MRSIRAQQREGSAVRGPVEIGNELRGKVCDLSPFGPIERLDPNVSCPLLSNHIGHGLPVGRELKKRKSARIYVPGIQALPGTARPTSPGRACGKRHGLPMLWWA